MSVRGSLDSSHPSWSPHYSAPSENRSSRNVAPPASSAVEQTQVQSSMVLTSSDATDLITFAVFGAAAGLLIFGASSLASRLFGDRGQDQDERLDDWSGVPEYVTVARGDVLALKVLVTDDQADGHELCRKHAELFTQAIREAVRESISSDDAETVFFVQPGSVEGGFFARFKRATKVRTRKIAQAIKDAVVKIKEALCSKKAKSIGSGSVKVLQAGAAILSIGHAFVTGDVTLLLQQLGWLRGGPPPTPV